MGIQWQSVERVVEEIMRIHRSLPERPSLDEIDAANSLVRNVEKEEQVRIDAISRQRKGFDVPDELFFVLQEMQRNLITFHSKEQKREALRLLDLEQIHGVFDEFVLKASKCCANCNSKSGGGGGDGDGGGDYSNGSFSGFDSSYSSGISIATSSNSITGFDSSSSSSVTPSVGYSEKARVSTGSEIFYSKDDSFLKKAKATLYGDGIGLDGPGPSLLHSSSIKSATSSGVAADKLSLIKLASVIELSAKRGTKDLDFSNKLMDQIEWVPDSLGKLSSLVTLDFSENRIIALPDTIGGLSSLTKLDLHANRITELPDSFADLFSLVYLDLRGNQLKSLPASFGKLFHLAELDISSNHLLSLPDTVGNLVSLKKLNIETNEIEELPHTIGHCSSLVELRADYNRLKALPEAVGRIESLEILSVRYNNIKMLPTTMASLSNLKELDVSFNELESVPESLCLATSIFKMNLGNNFSDMQSLPRSIGNLEMLEELDISNNQIRVLPDSFAMLSNLRVLRVQENPLVVPPRQVAEKGAQAVVQYMAELVAKRVVRSQPVKVKKTWAQFCVFSRPNKRKHDGLNHHVKV